MFWSRGKAEHTLYGLKFLQLGQAQQKRLEACFDYFGKNAHYR